jgi:hypothetical protein
VTFTTVQATRFGTGADLASGSSANTNLQINSEAIVTLGAGNQIRLVNIGTSTHHLANSVDGAAVNSVALVIEKLNAD